MSVELLRVLHADVQRRCAATLAEHPDWPCRKGCDLCCRRLAHIPELTAAEMELLARALERLSPAERQAAVERAESLRSVPPPYTCPFLDRGSGACLVYDARPVECRTYGFYADREAGLYCAEIQSRVERGEWSSVIWGNAEAVEARLDLLGARFPITARRSETRSA
jgi:Fe-S-cluster containining protein